MACILVVDQNENLARLEVLYLRSKGYQAVGVYSVSEAIQCMLNVIVDLVVLDLLTCMKEEARIGQALTTLVEAHDTPVLLLHPRSLVRGGNDICFLRERAADHIVKPFEIEALGQRVEALLARKAITARGLTPSLKVGQLTLDLQKFTLTFGDRHVPLTPTEFDLLRYLMEHAGETIPTQKLLEAVWEYPTEEGSPEVVRWHIKKLRDKLIQAGCSEVIRTIARRGYVIPVWVDDIDH